MNNMKKTLYTVLCILLASCTILSSQTTLERDEVKVHCVKRVLDKNGTQFGLILTEEPFKRTLIDESGQERVQSLRLLMMTKYPIVFGELDISQKTTIWWMFELASNVEHLVAPSVFDIVYTENERYGEMVWIIRANNRVPGVAIYNAQLSGTAPDIKLVYDIRKIEEVEGLVKYAFRNPISAVSGDDINIKCGTSEIIAFSANDRVNIALNSDSCSARIITFDINSLSWGENNF